MTTNMSQRPWPSPRISKRWPGCVLGCGNGCWPRRCSMRRALHGTSRTHCGGCGKKGARNQAHEFGGREPFRFFMPNSPSCRELTHDRIFPLCKRGIEGDFCICAKLKSPLPPFFKGGNVPSSLELRLINYFGSCQLTARQQLCCAWPTGVAIPDSGNQKTRIPVSGNCICKISINNRRLTKTPDTENAVFDCRLNAY